MHAHYYLLPTLSYSCIDTHFPSPSPPFPQDLFPAYYTLPTRLSAELQKAVAAACKEARPPLQHDFGFVSKVVQLQELLDVRHSVMLVGPAGCGKTTVWKVRIVWELLEIRFSTCGVVNG